MKEQTKGNVIILTVILLALLLMLNGLFLYYDRKISSGFVFERLGLLIANLEQGNDILLGYKTFPFVPYFLSTIDLITGLGLVNVVFLPILQIIGFIPIFLVSKIFFDSKKSLCISIPVFLYVFASCCHFTEYFMARVMFLFFIYCFFKYAVATKNKPIFAVLSLIFFAGTKFFGPPMETWIISFIFCFTLALLFIYTRRNASLDENCGFKAPVNFLILLAVIWLVYNPKFYDGLLYLDLSPQAFLNEFEVFVKNIFFPTPTRGEFVVTPISPMPLRVINTLYYFIIIILIIVALAYQILIKRQKLFWAKDIKDTFAVSLLIPFIVELILYGMLGTLPMRYLLLVYPIISMYWITKLPVKKIFFATLVILILLSGGSFVLQKAYEISHNFPSELQARSVVSYLGDNTQRGIRIMTDHHTYGSLRAFFAQVYGDPRYFEFRRYTSERYGKIVGNRTGQSFDFDLLLVNLRDLDKNTYGPGKPGEVGWKNFEPLDTYYPQIISNPALNQVYESQALVIFAVVPLQ